MGKGRGNTLEIPVDNVKVVQTRHTGQDEPAHNEKPITLTLLSTGEKTAERTRELLWHLAPITHWPSRLRRSKDLATDSELECDVVFCPRLEPLVKFDLLQTEHDQDKKVTSRMQEI